MICSPASPARCSTCGCSSSQSSTSGSGKCTANCLAPTTSNFRLDFFALLWYLMAIAALLFQRKVLIPDSIRVRAESRYFLFQVSTKGETTPWRSPRSHPCVGRVSATSEALLSVPVQKAYRLEDLDASAV